jgi:hypothetical protein
LMLVIWAEIGDIAANPTYTPPRKSKKGVPHLGKVKSRGTSRRKKEEPRLKHRTRRCAVVPVESAANVVPSTFVSGCGQALEQRARTRGPHRLTVRNR